MVGNSLKIVLDLSEKKHLPILEDIIKNGKNLEKVEYTKSLLENKIYDYK